MKGLSLLLVLLIAGCLILILWLANSGQVKEIHTETYKVALQLLLVTAIGQVASVLLAQASARREERKQRDLYRRELIARLNSAFSGTKKLRRLARSKCKKDLTAGVLESIPTKTYDQFMPQFNDLQLSTELIANDIESAQGLFKKYIDLYKNVECMEKYLNELVNEYEESNISSGGVHQLQHFSRLPYLFDLLGPYKTSKFRTEFVHAYYKALELLRNDLLLIGKNKSMKGPKANRA